jgi:hypothetical protein
MGTDIHLYIETRNGDGWEPVQPPFQRDEEGWSSYRTWSDYWKPWSDPPSEQTIPDPVARNYEVFAFLADVRNGYGFAGVPIFTPLEPQFAGRGIPEDTNYKEEEVDDDGEVVEEHPDNFGIWLGYHDFTWATLKELLEAPWDLNMREYGVIHVSEYDDFVKNGRPEHYSGGISGQGIKTFKSEQVFLEALDRGEIPDEELNAEQGRFGAEGKLYVRVAWDDSPLTRSSFYEWLNCDWVKELSRAADGPENVRVTMGFDS